MISEVSAGTRGRGEERAEARGEANGAVKGSPLVALSVRQPWATMLVRGLKSIEIRTWCRKFSGPLLIHAGRKLDTRMDVWQKLPRELWDEAKENTGGIIGRVMVTGWKTYRTAADFRADVPLHWNDPGWWMPPGPLFGLVCTEPEPLDFRAVRGMLGFFAVEG